jgi:acetate kinase
LGAVFDAVANQSAKTVISQPKSKVALYVVPTDEELNIARHTLSLLATPAGQAHVTR